jgi:hypothetical protein
MFQVGDRVVVQTGENPAYLSTGTVRHVFYRTTQRQGYCFIISQDCGDGAELVAMEDEMCGRPGNCTGGLKAEWYGRLGLYSVERK